MFRCARWLLGLAFVMLCFVGLASCWFSFRCLWVCVYVVVDALRGGILGGRNVGLRLRAIGFGCI